MPRQSEGIDPLAKTRAGWNARHNAIVENAMWITHYHQENSVREYTIENPGLRIDLRKLRKYTELEVLHIVENDYFVIVDGVLFSKDRKILLFYPIGKKDKSYHIPEGTESIGLRAFQTARYLKNVTMPPTVRRIYEGAFFGCESLESIAMSDAITEIPGISELTHDGVFEQCKHLHTVVFPKNLEYIGARAFLDCGKLDIKIPDGVEYIGDYAFAAYSYPENYYYNRKAYVPTNREKCEIPHTVKRIGTGALSGMKHVIVHEGTARGLICAIEATSAYEPTMAPTKMEWSACRISMIGRDGVTRPIRIPSTLKVETRKILDMAWNRDTFDFGLYAKCIEGIGDTQEKLAFALEFHRLDVGEGIILDYLRRVAPKLASQCVSEKREDELVTLLQYQLLTPETMKKLLAQCNKKNLSVAAAYILETLHTTKMPRASLRL